MEISERFRRRNCWLFGSDRSAWNTVYCSDADSGLAPEQGAVSDCEQALLAAYPSLRAEDLVNAWAYAVLTPIRSNGHLVARFYSNENIALQVVALTSVDAGAQRRTRSVAEPYCVVAQSPTFSFTPSEPD